MRAKQQMTTRFSRRTRSSGRWTSLLLLSILTAAIMPSVMAAPTGPAFWVNPCGFAIPPSTSPSGPDSAWAEEYALQLRITLGHINNWKETFTQSKFRVTFDTEYAWDDANHYDWLQVASTIPKKASQHLTATHYGSKNFNQMLTHSSDILQRFGVGWEQVDLEKTDKTFSSNFTNTVNNLKVTLCKLNEILADKNMATAPDPTRAIMPEVLRNPGSNSERDMRNFRILKDYVNALEYFADGFDYFSTASP